MNRRRFAAGCAGLFVPMAIGIRSARAEDDPADSPDPGCPAPVCEYTRVWRDVGGGSAGGHLEANVGDVRKIQPAHNSELRRLKANVKVRADGNQTTDCNFVLKLIREIVGWPDEVLAEFWQGTNGLAGTWERDLSVLAYRDDNFAERYYARVEVVRTTGPVQGWLNGPKSPAWPWVPMG